MKLYNNQHLTLDLNSKKIIKKIENFDKLLPQTIKDNLLYLEQLYFNSLIEREFEKSHLNKIKNIHNILIQTNLKIIYHYYSPKIFIDLSNKQKQKKFYKKTQPLLEQIIENQEIILEVSKNEKVKQKHLEDKEEEIYKKIRNFYLKNWYKFFTFYNKENILVPIYSGGLEPSLVFQNFLTFKTQIFPLRFSRFGKSDSYVKFPKYLTEREIKNSIQNKNLYIFDDIFSSGMTIKKTIHTLNKYNPRSFSIICIKQYHPYLSKIKDKKEYNEEILNRLNLRKINEKINTIFI